MTALVTYRWAPIDGVTRVGDHQDREVLPGELVMWTREQAEAMSHAWASAMQPIAEPEPLAEQPPAPFVSETQPTWLQLAESMHWRHLVALAERVAPGNGARNKHDALAALHAAGPDAVEAALAGE